MEFRMDFSFRIVMDCAYYAINLLFYKIIFINSSTLAGWNESQAFVFVAAFCVVDGLQMTLFSNNMWMLPNLVNKGGLDYYLLRPISSLFFISLRDFAVNSFINLLFASGILWWAIAQYPDPFETWKVVVFIFLMINGCFLHQILHLLMILPVFWIHSGRGLEQIFYGLTRVMERPDQIFSGVLRILFTTILPFSIMASFPARFLFESGNEATLLSHMFLVTCLMGFLLAFVWNRALKNYSSASS